MEMFVVNVWLYGPLARYGGEAVRKASQCYIDNNIKLVAVTGLFFPLMLLLTNLSLALVLLFGGRRAILGEITIGDFVAFISYLNLLAWPMMALFSLQSLVGVVDFVFHTVGRRDHRLLRHRARQGCPRMAAGPRRRLRLVKQPVPARVPHPRQQPPRVQSPSGRLRVAAKWLTTAAMQH